MPHGAAYRVHNPSAHTADAAGSVPHDAELRRVDLRLVAPSPATLTRREMQCLCWCAEGKSYWEAGVILGICERTVSFHMEAVRSKLGAGSNAHAVALAFKAGLLRP